MSCLGLRPNTQLGSGSKAADLQVLYGASGSCSAYFPRLLKLGQQLCLCPDCRADGGGDGLHGTERVHATGEAVSCGNSVPCHW